MLMLERKRGRGGGRIVWRAHQSATNAYVCPADTSSWPHDERLGDKLTSATVGNAIMSMGNETVRCDKYLLSTCLPLSVRL